MSGPSSNNDVKAKLDGKKLSNRSSVDKFAGRSAESSAEGDQPVVLIVDDSKTVLRSATDILNNIGLSVVTASDGFEALAKVVDTKPSLLFMDITMPRLDGYQTCALIKNNADFRAIPVIMLSGKDGLFDLARGRVAGADDHLTKPFDEAQMSATVEKHLGALVKFSHAHETDATISS